MNNSKYTYKNRLPKKWDKRKKIQTKGKYKPKPSSLWQRSSVRQKLVKSAIKRKVPRLGNHRSARWKHPAILFLVSLLVIILIIPTLIVAPFAQDKEVITTSEGSSSTEEVAELEIEEPSLTVSVMRTSTDEKEEVPLEIYVARVVASEMPAEFELEALKAQALAARTYLVNHLLYQEDLEQSEILDTTDHQVYKDEEELRALYGSDYTWKMEKLTKAVKATEGMILTYNSKPITPAFFSTSNGYTENSEDYWENELPYLRSVESPWDKNSPQFLDQKTFTIKNVADILGAELPSEQSLRMEIDRTKSNRVKQLKINDFVFTGREIREKLDLKSSDFEIQQKNNHLIFTTKGFGHGIGMSQYGANGLAQEGKSYEEIVKYYYQDVELSPIGETAPTLVVRK